MRSKQISDVQQSSLHSCRQQPCSSPLQMNAVVTSCISPLQPADWPAKCRQSVLQDAREPMPMCRSRLRTLLWQLPCHWRCRRTCILDRLGVFKSEPTCCDSAHLGARGLIIASLKKTGCPVVEPQHPLAFVTRICTSWRQNVAPILLLS